MGLFEMFRKKNSGNVAKDRLKLLLVSDRANCSPDVMEMIKNDIIKVITTILGENVDKDFDTLKEVADWIASDKEGSAALQTTVSEHTESISTLTGELDALETKVDGDIANLTTHMSEAATALAEVDGRLDALEAFEETHASIEVTDIEGLFA